jgi:ATP-dependent Lhr-like helicase
LRIGLSATQNPISLVGEFLVGDAQRRSQPQIVLAGERRVMDLAIEIPDDELSSVTTHGMWDCIYDRIAELSQEHRSTLVFVNTRALVERLAFQLSERIGADNVAAHHGSLSRTMRLQAEQKLKAGEVKVLIATASLELGIDIGSVELVCQVGTPRAVSVGMQRIGRAGHWRGAVPKGRFFATTRDELIEVAALIRAMRAGELDRLEIPHEPLDVLMQQIVAACAAEPWNEDDLFDVVRRAYPYRELTRETWNEVIALLTDGIEASRGRYGAYLLRDRVHGRIQARRGARMVAVSNGGTIPDTAMFSVIMQPEGLPIATLDEHFAVDSSAGDVIQLGNTSWRIQRIESAGKVFVEDAHGQPPSVPFWQGEAPQRTLELSGFVAKLREEISQRTPNVLPGYIAHTQEEVGETVAWLKSECAVDDSAALQMIGYIVAGRAVLGAVPTMQTIIAERFFDEGGGMQLILHAPFGGRINKAWGLALRKRFCRGFNFELQAAATDNGLNISLAEQHSFPLSDVFQFLTTQTVTELLQQASLTSPIFKSRWRWDAGRALQLLRFYNGKKIAPQIQRSRSDDLLASVFPQVAACQENVEGDIQIPDHPLVREVMKDVLGEAMDLDGLIRVLEGIDNGSIRCLAVDTTVPSQFAHELINANPYSFLDDADLQERRARAVSLRRSLPANALDSASRLDPAAIASVREDAWPDIRDEHELHDLLCMLTVFPSEMLEHSETRHWPLFFARLVEHGRAAEMRDGDKFWWVAAERLERARTIFPKAVCRPEIVAVADEVLSADDALLRVVQNWLQLLGPVTARSVAEMLRVEPADIYKAMLRLEMTGMVLRGQFENVTGPVTYEIDIEWCERRLLQRIHQRTVATLRKQIEAVTPADYMRWLLAWQHVAPQSQLAGEHGLLEVLRQLAGFEAPAIEWERSLLPSRVSDYDPRWLDALCLSGVVGWSRISPHSAFLEADARGARRVVPTSMAPITFFVREESEWLDLCGLDAAAHSVAMTQCLSGDATRVHAALASGGALFLNDIERATGLAKTDAQRALWELVAAGMASADAFDNLRVLIDPRRKAITQSPARMQSRNRPRTLAGRWWLLSAPDENCGGETAIESVCWMLLRRYGVLWRDLLSREAVSVRWRDLLPMLRRLEARGQIRGGRFVSGFAGEQFAMPEAVVSLRECRRTEKRRETVAVTAADPLNLAGVVLPGEKIPINPRREIIFCDGVLAAEVSAEAVVPSPAILPWEETLAGNPTSPI